MLLFIIPLPNLEKRNFGAQERTILKRGGQVYKEARYPPEVFVQFEAPILVEE